MSAVKSRRWMAAVTLLAVTGLVVVGLSTPATAAGGTPVDGNMAMGWGANAYGQVGDPATVGTRVVSPVVIAGMANGITQVSSGHAHSLAVRSDGMAFAWGDNETGALGDGTTNDSSTPVGVLNNVTQVAAGWGFSLALRKDGTVWGWGLDSSGQLGDGTASEEPRLSPVQVVGLTGVAQIAAGANFSLAVLSDGTMRAWGLNTWGQLGVGRSSQFVMSPVALPVVGLTGVTQAAAGADFALARLADGTVQAWGDGSFGALGDGTTVGRTAPAPVPGLTGVGQVACGWVHSLAVLSDGTVRTWGSNNGGELGDGTTTRRTVPTPVPGVSGVTQVSGGVFYSMALHSDGTVVAWGYNSDGQLGTGDLLSHLTAVAVPGLTNVKQISAGHAHSLAKVAGPAFSVALDHNSGSARAGGRVSAQVTLTALNGFAGKAILTASGLPAGVSASFAPGQLSAGHPATLTIATSPSSPIGTFTVTITATGDAVQEPVRTVTYNLTITAL